MHLLDRIYSLYENLCRSFQTVCRAGCSLCCTPNVTLTTLEGTVIVEYLRRPGLTDLLENIRKASGSRRFHPQVTTNRLALLSIQGEELPEEEIHADGDACPFLTDGRCPIYDVRPFACRCMVSTQTCSEGGSALMDPFWVTINTLFLQIIEHIDAEGFTGNLVDVLILLDSAGDGRPDPNPSLKQGLLVPNLRVPALMIPPEHRERIGPVIHALKQLENLIVTRRCWNQPFFLREPC